ncbi:MAG: hypothetical protein A3G23_01225 [Bacteroidetes bacterium RIFCSPLOWO2_12_FULL_37_12]|nr:MAG: hypothetical protein A3G23_01225 [Bacteroidetes bacterium RIFCSPLOWO2_12_FULL_37_12]
MTVLTGKEKGKKNHPHLRPDSKIALVSLRAFFLLSGLRTLAHLLFFSVTLFVSTLLQAHCFFF